MKKKNIFIVLSLALSMLLGLTACSSNEDVSSNNTIVKMEDGSHVMSINFDCEAPVYDAGTTRAVTNNWGTGATLFARVKNGSSYLKAQVVHDSGNWYLRWWGDLAMTTTPVNCELYYLQESNGDYYAVNRETKCFDIYNNGTKVKATNIPWDADTIDMSEGTAVYGTTEATYTYTSSGFTMKATLKPLMWRLRFSGTNGTSITMPGNDNDIMYCSVFNWSASAMSFTKAAKDVSLTVSSGYTPYIYGEFKNPSSSNNITVKNGNDTYTRTFNGSNLKAGTSGYFTIPTASNYSSNGWKRDTGGVLFEEPYCGWATSLSTVQAVVASMGYTTNYNTESSYLMCSAKNQEVAIYYNFEKERLDYVDVYFNESVATVSDVRNYLSSTLNYTYLGSRTADDGTVLYYYDLPDKVTRAYVYRWVASSGTAYAIVVFYGLTDAIIFEEPYTNWGATQSTTKTALENMGYTVTGSSSNLDLTAKNCKYKEDFLSYRLDTSKGLEHVTIFFKASQATINAVKNYVAKILKYTYIKESGKHYYYSVPDGKSEFAVYTSDEGEVRIWYDPVKTSAPSMAPSMIEEQQMKDIANQAAKMRKHETVRSTRDADSFAKDVERINKRIANRLK